MVDSLLLSLFINNKTYISYIQTYIPTAITLALNEGDMNFKFGVQLLLKINIFLTSKFRVFCMHFLLKKKIDEESYDHIFMTWVAISYGTVSTFNKRLHYWSDF